MSPTERFLAYLRCYAAKDLDSVAAMFADDIVLRDWNLRVCGRAAVLAETRKNFDSVTSIAIEPLQIYENARGVAGELRIVIDGSLELHVVDVIEFNEHRSITAIRAYIGRGDGA